MIRLILDWLAARFGYVRRKYPRIHNGADAVARGQRWEAFYQEEGGIADMIVRLRMGYFEASAALGVRDLDKRYEYALADRLARELEREVLTVIETGKMRQAQAVELARMAAVRR